mmetsp:Transcript_12757/g.20635  ORF Transcript_12757/g.20635 Transcript_12757/m.20635 type:complete len:150 (-) Transcript_12757:527-976(-)
MGQNQSTIDGNFLFQKVPDSVNDRFLKFRQYCRSMDFHLPVEEDAKEADEGNDYVNEELSLARGRNVFVGHRDEGRKQLALAECKVQTLQFELCLLEKSTFFSPDACKDLENEFWQCYNRQRYVSRIQEGNEQVADTHQPPANATTNSQ